MAQVYPEYSYDLPGEVLAEIAREFPLEAVVERYQKEVARGEMAKEEVAASVFGEWGRELARTVMAREDAFKDRTAELVRAVAQKTGIIFPHLPQLYLEVALLATRPEDKWVLNASTPQKLTYTVQACTLYRLLCQREGEEETSLTSCRYACLELARELYRILGLEVELNLEARPKENFCRLEAKRQG